MKIAVFGANGMLGRYVSKVLSDKFDVLELTRKDIDISDFSQYVNIDKLISGCDYVVNCAGAIKPVVNKQPAEISFMCNTVFPHYLAYLSEHKDYEVFHITTDCVFSGDDGLYDELQVCDVNDAYGLSKRFGEVNINCNIRTSIIGEEVDNGRSLLEWAKSNANKEVNGFTNHYWNGVTCLELAKYISFLIENKLWWNGTSHFYSDIVNKYELLQMISDAFGLNLTINPVESSEPCNRTLSSIYNFEYSPIPLNDQIVELAEFHSKLFGNS